MSDMPVINKLKCNQCGYEWYPRTPELPKVCPNCKHRNWKEEVKHVKKSGRPKKLQTI
jgi:predicted Zn-ribbon and HTH transcriptional regulator